MTKDYQPKKNNPYELPHSLYMQALWLVRDYDRLKTEYHEALWDSPDPPDGQPRGENIGDPTEREGIKRAELSKRLEAVEQALIAVPEEYRVGVEKSVKCHEPYPVNADKSTYSKHKARFIYKVAEKMLWV